jgi:uncharacterized protein
MQSFFPEAVMSCRLKVRAVLVIALASAALQAQTNPIATGAFAKSRFGKLLSQAERGNPRAQLLVGEAYKNGEGTPPDTVESLRWISRAANSGEPIAQFEMGLSYLSGTERDTQRAFAWYLRAATAGMPAAINAVGSMYFGGVGVRRDEQEAVRWFQRGAQLGYSPAEANLGYVYSTGQGVAASPKLALKWLKKAAKQHDSQAMFHFAYLYDGCRCGFADDPARAANWYQKAAAAGHPAAENNLSILYAKGKGVPRDLSRALDLAKRSAEHGNPNAYWGLFHFSSRGLGTPVDKVASLAWLILAAQANPQNQKIAAEMAEQKRLATPANFAAATTIAAKWQSVHTPESIEMARIKYGIVVAMSDDADR